MALVFYEKKTNILRRIVYDENQTDKELSKNHRKQSDEKVVSTELRREDFPSDKAFIDAIQALIGQSVD